MSHGKRQKMVYIISSRPPAELECVLQRHYSADDNAFQQLTTDWFS